MQAERSVIHFPKQSKPTSKKHPKEKCTVLEWIRNGWQFPGKPAPSDKGGARIGKAEYWSRTATGARRTKIPHSVI
jgi:hypothetical protein